MAEFNIDFFNEERLLKENQEVQKMVNVYMEALGLKPELKGFTYLSDIMTLALVRKKYSRTTMAELTPFIAWKYGIKPFSVQRQLRYTCTLQTKGKYIVNTVAEKVWQQLKPKIDEEREEQ